MTSVFDTIVNRGSVAAPPPNTTIASVNGLTGGVYSIYAELFIAIGTAASLANMFLMDGLVGLGVDIARGYSLFGPAGTTLYGTITIPRWTLVNGLFSVRNGNADATNYDAQISITPLRGAFQA